MHIVLPLWTITAWGLTVALTSYLLSGTFETRTCQSDCVWILYWVVFSVTVAGCLVGGWWLFDQSIGRGRGAPPLAVVSFIAMAFLLIIFLTTMAIGIFA